MDLQLTLTEALHQAATRLPEPVVEALKAAADEAEGTAETQLKTILENIQLATEKDRPLCQDTGLQTFFVEVGENFPYLEKIRPAITGALETATEQIPLRPNTVDPFSEVNPGDNSGSHMPFIHWNVVEGNSCVIHLLPKGGGAENMCGLKMQRPAAGMEGVKEFVLQQVVEAGGKPCPPVIVGVGLGGGADLALELGKRALLRPVGEINSHAAAAELEQELLETINESGGGPMGLGGVPTALDVHVEYAARHPASFPVGLVVQCWAHRHAVVEVNSSGESRVK